MNRCANCMEPYARHVIRAGAVPICPDYMSRYHEATEEQVEGAYWLKFPGGHGSVDVDQAAAGDPAARVRDVLGAEAMEGDGLAELEAQLRDASK